MEILAFAGWGEDGRDFTGNASLKGLETK